MSERPANTDGTAGVRWSAVIINYNAGALLTKCVASVFADASAGLPNIVVVDNASSDSSLADLRAQFPEVAVVETGANLGYARAANLGIASTTTSVVAVLNPDLVFHPGTAAAMLARVDSQTSVGAVGPEIRNVDGSVYPSARNFIGLGAAVGHATLGAIAPHNRWTRAYRGEARYGSGARAVDWCSGAALWLRRSALDAVGGWDERYFMYVEDVDLCWRLGRAGFEVWYEPAGVVTHVQGATTRARPYRMIIEHHRSWWKFTKVRWQGARRALLPITALFLVARAALACGSCALRRRLRGRSPQ
ncbi:MAG: glycosyltransferase family 2 protein [Acidimicrobiia bacterium]